MFRRQFLIQFGIVCPSVLLCNACVSNSPANNELIVSPLHKPVSEWRSLLARAEYNILFEEGTEPPGSSPLNDEKRKGTYVCAACYLPIFDSRTKYDSNTGWPSFFRALRGRIGTKPDMKMSYRRTEYHCVRCGGHQGHVFADGPRPTGERYCNNGLALRFYTEDQPLPELRS